MKHKDYFAKLLPVPGPINEVKGHSLLYKGSVVLFELRLFDANGTKPTSKITVHNGRKYIIIEDAEVQNLQMFICSTKLHIGDRVIPFRYYGPAETVGGFKEGSKELFFFEGADASKLKNLHSTQNWGKVLGEVSEEALSYVIDLKRYDRDDLKVLLKHDTDFRRFNDDILPNHISYFAIKGPCNHYH